MKKHIAIFLLILLSGNIMQLHAPTEHASATNNTEVVEFVIVIPSFNNEKWARDNLQSACHQLSSRPYEIICINDASSDRTGELMDEYIKEKNLGSRVKVIHNQVNMGGVANIYNTVHEYIADHKVVVLLDGDDMLAHDEVLVCLEKYYSDPGVLMTYGSVKRSDNGESLNLAYQVPHSVLYRQKLREYPFTATHLRTFKAGLFKKIHKEDLMYQGSFAPAAWDLAIMFPMLEMACGDHNCSEEDFKVYSRYIPDMLYIYRIDNPLSDHFLRVQLQREIDVFIRSKEPYLSLEYSAPLCQNQL